jgi:hypothetical protein
MTRVRLADNFKSLLDELPNLSLDQLRELENKVAVSKSLKHPSSENDGELEQFHNQLDKKLTSALGQPKTNFHSIKKRQYYGKLIKAHKFVVQFLDAVVNPKPATDVYKVAFFRLYAELMYDYQKKIPNYPLSLDTLVTTYDKFPDLIDRSYPGYVTSGCGDWIFRPKQNPDDLKI